jgi:exodeoxyribonuclease VII small subunit
MTSERETGPASANRPETAETPIAFEQALRRLGEIVQTLERGDLPLEQSVLLFEEGVKLSVISQQRLDSAQKKVEELLGVDSNGRVRTAPFSTRGEEGQGRSE